MKKRPLKGTREANTMVALVCVTTIHLISPQAHAVDLTIDSGTTTINSDTTYGITKIANTAGQSATLEVTSGTLTNTSSFFVGFNGTGTLNLTGGNLTTGQGYISYVAGSSGTATVSGGSTWTVGGAFAVGFNGAIGTLTIGDGGKVIASDVSRNNNSTINLNAGGTLQINGSSTTTFLSVSGALTNNGTLIFNRGSGNTSQSGVFSGSGRLVKQGSGTLRLTGANTYSGGSTISAGTLSVGSGGTTGSIAGDVINNATLAFNRSNDLTYAGIVSGTGAVTKSGAGTLTLTGANTYAGASTVSAGALNIQNADALGTTAAGTSVTSGAALQIQGGITTAAEALTLNGTGVTATGALRNISGDNTHAGLVTLGAASRINSDAGTLTLSHTGTITGATFGLTVGGAGNTTIASIIGTTSGTLTKDGAGTLTLSGANTFTGATAVSTGVLNIKHADALGTTAAGTTVTSGAALQIQGGITTAAEALTLNGTGVSTDGALRNISGTNTHAGLVTLGAATRINSDAGTLTLSNTGTITGATLGLTVGGAGNTTIASVIGTTSGTLTKDGAGTLTLSGANTYTGATTVTAGLLTVNGNISSSALTTVGDGATLGGSGTVGALVVETGATLAPGNSPGTLTASGNVTWQAGGNYNWQLVDALGTAGTGWDTLAISGVLDLTALSSANPFNLNLWSLFSAEAVAGDVQNFDSGGSFSWAIATAAGGITGFDAVDFFIHTGAINGTNGFTNDLAGGTFSLAVVDGNQLNLVYNGLSAVPEPSGHLALLALGAGGLTLRRRLKRVA